MPIENMAAYMAERRLRRRSELIEILGSACVVCGTSEDLEIDHIDPATKSFDLNGPKLDKPWAQLLAEAEKCQLLCHNDHIEKTISERELSAHGTMNRYLKYRCRCTICVVSYAEIRKRHPSRQNQSS